MAVSRPATPMAVDELLPLRRAVLVFLACACAYFLSALIRAITATLAPTLTAAFSLDASQLGLLAGAYFVGFSLTQLPLGVWLDRHGPRRMLLVFLGVALFGCLAFAAARTFEGLLVARLLCGIGVSACLMAPLTGYRRWLTPEQLQRANSWMLMTGSLGMLFATLPVQWLLPVTGWRPLFVMLALLVLAAMALIAWQLPRWPAPPAPRVDGPAGPDDPDQPTGPTVPTEPAAATGYGLIWRNRYFWRLAPMGFVVYGGLVALQTLWASPWMTVVGGYTPTQAAAGLFTINLCMLVAFWLWGMATPALYRRGWDTSRLLLWGLPVGFAAMALLLVLGPRWPGGSALLLSLYCVCTSVVALAQPAAGLAFPSHLAGRALTAYNLIIFSGVFAVQWGIGLGIDALVAAGTDRVTALQTTFGVLGLLGVGTYGWFVLQRGHNPQS